MSAKPELQGSGVVPTGNRWARDEIVALKGPLVSRRKESTREERAVSNGFLAPRIAQTWSLGVISNTRSASS